jgi:hypothetical protein
MQVSFTLTGECHSPMHAEPLPWRFLKDESKNCHTLQCANFPPLTLERSSDWGWKVRSLILHHRSHHYNEDN